MLTTIKFEVITYTNEQLLDALKVVQTLERSANVLQQPLEPEIIDWEKSVYAEMKRRGLRK